MRRIKVSHECAVGCPKCYGTGEGWSENSSCTQCRGNGTLWNRGEQEDEYEVEWSRSDLSDLEIIDGHDECSYCKQDLRRCVKEELQWATEKLISSVLCVDLIY